VNSTWNSESVSVSEDCACLCKFCILPSPFRPSFGAHQTDSQQRIFPCCMQKLQCPGLPYPLLRSGLADHIPSLRFSRFLCWAVMSAAAGMPAAMCARQHIHSRDDRNKNKAHNVKSKPAAGSWRPRRVFPRSQVCGLELGGVRVSYTPGISRLHIESG
jgi:hypothetical protein